MSANSHRTLHHLIFGPERTKKMSSNADQIKITILGQQNNSMLYSELKCAVTVLLFLQRKFKNIIN